MMSYIKLYCCLYILIIALMLVSLSCRQKHIKEYEQEVTEYPEKEYIDTTKVQTDEKVAPDKYSYQWIDTQDIPPVAIVIDDFGQISGELLKGFAELDENITFAVLPDLPHTAKSAQMANVYGHEVIIHIPMEAMDSKQNPGKRYIGTALSADEIKHLINDFIDQIPQAVGANNHMGSRITADYESMLSVLKILKRKDLFFLDSKTSANSIVLNAAREIDIDYSARDIFLDVPDNSAATVNAKIKELEKYRGRVEPIIIISHCHNQAKLDTMRNFVNQLKGLGIKLIPLSDAVKKYKIQA